MDRGLLSLAALSCAALALPLRLSCASPENDPALLIQAAKRALQASDFARAADLYVSAIGDLDRAGVEETRLVSPLLDLGRIREAAGRCQEASDLMRRAIRILEAAPRADLPQTSEAYGALAKAYNCQHQYSKAEQAFGHGFDLERSAPHPRPDRLIELLAGQGVVYESEGRFTEAEAVFQRAELVLQRSPQINAIPAALLLNNKGSLLRDMGKLTESEAAFRRGLTFAETAGTWDHGVEASLQYNLATLDAARKQFRSAADRFAQAVRLIESGTSLPPRAIGGLLRDYAACLRKLGNRREAKALEDRAAALLSRQTDGNGRLVVDVAELRRLK